MRRAIGGLTVVGAVVVGLLSGCDANGSRAAVASHDSVTSLSGRRLDVRVPDGDLQVRLGRPVGSVGGEKPPSGWSYVPVGALLDASSNLIGAVKGVSWGVVADGRTVRLPAPYTTSGSGLSVDNTGAVTYVPVPDHGREVTVSVTYDGLTQTASTTGKRVAGDAGPYYVPDVTGRFGKVPVAGPWTTAAGKQLEVAGTVAGIASPYLPGRGWAKPGREFLGLDVALQEVRATGDPLSVLTLEPSVDGATPLGPVPTSSAASVTGTYWFDVSSSAAHVLTMRATYGGITGTKRVPMN